MDNSAHSGSGIDTSSGTDGWVKKPQPRRLPSSRTVPLASSESSPPEHTHATKDEPDAKATDVAKNGDEPAKTHEAKEADPAEDGNGPAMAHDAHPKAHDSAMTGETAAHTKLTPENQAESVPALEPEPRASSTTDAAVILRKRPFIIRTVRHSGTESGAGDVTGSILSQSLDKLWPSSDQGPTDAGNLTLAGLRKLVPQMSRYPQLEKFCTASGTLIDDEAISFREYLGLEESAEVPASSVSTPSLELYFSSTKTAAKVSSLGAKAKSIIAKKKSGGAEEKSDGTDSPAQEAPDSSEGPAVKTDDAPEAQSLEKSQPAADLFENQEFQAGAGGAQSSASALNEDDWASVLRNCAVFYGWNMDPRSGCIKQAPKPAFRLRSKVADEAVAKIPDMVQSVATTSTSADSGTAAPAELPLDGISADETATAGEFDDDGVESKVSILSGPTKFDKGIPNFRVNDDSRIEITAHESDLSVSMARSDFSETSTDASVGGGGWGISASVSAGHAESKSDNTSNRTDSTSTTLVARYMFPRCDLLLWPDELEPTPELEQLLTIIRKTKDIKALRRLHAEFGHLFCQKVTLGGRLLSTKISTSTDKKSLDEQKESFKTSVGASVSGSFAGFSASASFKHDESHGSTTTNETSQHDQSQAAVFEAVGGDTILTNNPEMWSPTVANHLLWRVINREGLSPLVDTLSGIPGYEEVQSWFVQAVPALSRYMVLDDAHECKARLRVMSPTNSLSIPNATNNASFYLGHDVNRPVTPRLNGVNSTERANFWVRIDLSEDVPIFNPQTYRAPAILGYDNFDIEGVKYGAEYNAAFLKSEWTIIAPFDEELTHGTRVVLRSNPYVDPSQVTTAGGTAPPAPNPSHMVVFRNAQGEFLPAMSDSDEYQYWRLVKTDASQPHIKPGDEVRLCWDFNDQTTGWRDFTKDVFGRRQVCAPSDAASGPLFLKVPWPRFETTGNPTALIMSPDRKEVSAKAVSIDEKGNPTVYKYVLQDLRLRIDNVTNNGRGDAEDYLLNKVQQQGIIQSVSVRVGGYPLQMRRAMFWFGLRGP